ncbi:hypothetical protein [Mycobacterium kyorinense]|uniref:hypothetical protein n=1 Tax=Mycobacterium kyorinense TaxID=487514 RepID=UPI000AE50332|nr:hypothetical protein [Mycobacterium kyorinense]
MSNHLEDACTFLDSVSQAVIGDADDAAKVDRWLRMAQINALLAIAQAVKDR